MVSPSLSFFNTVFKTHNSNSKPITHNSKPTITQKLQNFCLLTKPNHISQLLSPSFAKMVEPTDQSFSTVFFPYLHDSTWRTWNPHPNPVSSPPPTTNPDSTTINTTNSHTKNPKECTGNPQPNLTSPKKKKNNAKKKKIEAKKWSSDLKQWNNSLCCFGCCCCYGNECEVQADVAGEASNFEVHVSHNPTWAQSDVVSRIPCTPLQQEGLVLLSLSLMPQKKSKRMHSKPKPQT